MVVERRAAGRRDALSASGGTLTLLLLGARRGGAAALTLLLLSLAVFVIFGSLPGDPLTGAYDAERGRGLDPAAEQALRRQAGLDDPLLLRFGRWALAAGRGDLGLSLRSRRPVTEELRGRIVASVELAAASTLLALLAALPFGWWLASRRGSFVDRGSMAILLAIYALPVFWLAMMAQGLFAVKLGWLPLYGRLPGGEEATAAARLRHLLLPAGCLALHQAAFFTRFARDTARQGIVALHALFARACGESESRITWRHGIRPALVPLATLLGLLVPSLVSGSILIETLFAWPGLGRLLVQAIGGRDFPVVLALTVLIGALTIAGNLLADLATFWLDPRLREQGP